MKETTLTNLIGNIPAGFFRKASYIILMAYCLSLPVTMLYMAFFWDNIQGYCIETLNTVIMLMVSLYLLHRFVNTPKIDLKALLNFQIWDLLFLALLIWSGISTLLAEDPELAILGTPYRGEGFSMYLAYACIYICSKLIMGKNAPKTLITTYVISISFLSIMTVIQANETLLSALGVIGENLNGLRLNCMQYAAIYPNTNHYAYVLNMAVIGLAGLYLISNGWKKYLYLALFGFNTWALILNNTFGSYLGSLLGLIFLAVIFVRRNKQALKSSLLVIALFLVISIATSVANEGILLGNFINLFSEAFGEESLFENDDAGSGRIGLWKQAFKYIGEKPLFGFGPEGLHSKYYEDGFHNDRPHNEYIQYAVFTGIPSLVFYLGALITILVHCLKNLKNITPELTVIGGMIFAYCVSAFFGNTMYNTSIYFFMFIGLLSTCLKIGKEG